MKRQERKLREKLTELLTSPECDFEGFEYKILSGSHNEVLSGLNYLIIQFEIINKKDKKKSLFQYSKSASSSLLENKIKLTVENWDKEDGAFKIKYKKTTDKDIEIVELRAKIRATIGKGYYFSTKGIIKVPMETELKKQDAVKYIELKNKGCNDYVYNMKDFYDEFFK